MTPSDWLTKLKLIPPQFQAAIGAILLFYFWSFFILPVFSLVDLKKNQKIPPGQKKFWAAFIVLSWGVGSGIYQVLKGVSKFRKFSGLYALLIVINLVVNFEKIRPFISGPPRLSLSQMVKELESQENPRLSLAHRIDWSSDLKVLDAEIKGAMGNSQTREIRELFLNLYEKFREKNKLDDDTFLEWKNVFIQRDSLDKKTLEGLIHAFENIEANPANLSKKGTAAERLPIAGPPIPLTLKLGTEYPAAGQSMSIPIQAPLKLDGLTRSQILELRARAIRPFSRFLRDQYQPRPEVFGQIADGKPWYGDLGLYFYGSGPNVTQGMSERSKSILNPFVLLWPSLYSSTLTANKLWRTSISEKELKSSEFPTAMGATQLVWSAAEKNAKLKMGASAYLNKLRPLLKVAVEQIPMKLSIEAINARDFGLDYIIWNEKESTRIKYEQSYFPLFRTKQFYQLGGSCGLFEGCNNLSPFEKELNSFTIESLPASLTFDLWAEEHLKSTEPDFKFIIEFE